MLLESLLFHIDIIGFKELGDLQTKNCFYIYLTKKSNLTDDFNFLDFGSNEFCERTLIQDFAIRGQAVWQGPQDEDGTVRQINQ